MDGMAWHHLSGLASWLAGTVIILLAATTKWDVPNDLYGPRLGAWLGWASVPLPTIFRTWLGRVITLSNKKLLSIIIDEQEWVSAYLFQPWLLMEWLSMSPIFGTDEEFQVCLRTIVFIGRRIIFCLRDRCTKKDKTSVD